MGPRAGLDGCGKSRPHRDSTPGPSQPVAQSLYRLSYRAHRLDSTISETSKKNCISLVFEILLAVRKRAGALWEKRSSIHRRI